MILDAVYEQEFVDGSYGFRPGRSAHRVFSASLKKMAAPPRLPG